MQSTISIMEWPSSSTSASTSRRMPLRCSKLQLHAIARITMGKIMFRHSLLIESQQGAASLTPTHLISRLTSEESHKIGPQRSILQTRTILTNLWIAVSLIMVNQPKLPTEWPNAQASPRVFKSKCPRRTFKHQQSLTGSTISGLFISTTLNPYQDTMNRQRRSMNHQQNPLLSPGAMRQFSRGKK